MASNRDWGVSPTTFTVPFGTGPDGARTVIVGGADVPADLQAYYTALGQPVVGAILHYTDATVYYYDANLAAGGGLNAHAYGWSNAGVIIENEQTFLQLGTPDIEWGLPVATAFMIGSPSRAPSANEFWRFNSSILLAINGGLSIDSISAPRTYLDANVTDNGAVAASVGAGNAESAIPAASWDNEPTYAFVDGRIYRVDLKFVIFENVGAAQLCAIRVRKGSASTVGTIFGQWQLKLPAGFVNFGQSETHHCYIKNTSGGDVNSKLSLTIQRATAGAGTTALYGDATFPLIMAVRDVGNVFESTWTAIAAVTASV